MKTATLTIIGLLLSGFAFGQVKLSDTEKEMLMQICNQYNVALKESSLKNLQKTAPVRFQGFIEQLIV